jgi:replicative DNA helicase
MMLSGEAIADVIGQLKADDFYKSGNREIYESIYVLYSRGDPVDAITVVEELRRRDSLERVGGHLYIHELVEQVSTPASAAHYARIVAEAALLRRLIRASADIMELGYSSPQDPQDAADSAEDMIYQVARHSEKDEPAAMADLVDTAMSELEKIQQRESAFAGIPTHFTELDKLTAGLQGGNLIVIAARPGVGKSSFVTNVARNVVVESQTPVAMFSLEMSKWEIGMRLLCGEARVPWDRIRTGHPSPEDWSHIVEAAEVLHEAPLFVVDSGNVNIVEIRAKARRLRSSRQGLGMIIVDYLQLMSSHSRVESRQQEIADISRNLKLLAKELDIPVIAVSQLNRDPERRQDKRPQLSDLRESGAIEQDADIVMFIHREDSDDPSVKGTADLIIAKHRNGPTDTIKLTFLPSLTQFRNYAPAP